MNSLTISKTTARRYILGKQGLWPGRRWAGKAGTARAIRHMEAVQIDPLTVVARSHDLVLHSRVVDYRPEYLDRLMHHDREFFDYGEGLFIYPMDELPYWRVPMQRRIDHPRWADFAAENAALLDEVRGELRTRGPLGNRDFTNRARVTSYRARKDSGLALYYLWVTGELMTHHRQGNFERAYDFRDNVVPPMLRHAATLEDLEYFFALKTVAFWGLCRARAWVNTFSGFIERKVDWAEAQTRLEQLVAADELSVVQVEGWKEPHYCLSADRSILAQLEKGQVPKAWRPIDTTTDEEAVFLAPLEIVSARGRAKLLFDFDYVWEIYKPAHTRRWGYYTLPILYGDRLVARIDPKLDRSTQTLIIKGLWLEDSASADDPAFIQALARGLQRFVQFMRAEQLDLSALQPRSRRKPTAEQKAIVGPGINQLEGVLWPNPKRMARVIQSLLSDPRVTEAQMFGMPCAKIGGKAFVGLFKKNLVIKIGAPRVEELLKARAGRKFDPSGRQRPMKEWIMIPESAAAKKWLAFATEAKVFVEQK